MIVNAIEASSASELFVTKKCLAYLADVGYNVHQEVDVLWELPVGGDHRDGV